MNRRTFIGAMGTGTALALSGCTSPLQLTSSNDPVGAAGGNGENAGGYSRIEVVGRGEVPAEPEIARLQVAVEASADEAEAVRADLAGRIDEIESALIAEGIPADDIATSRYRIGEKRNGFGYEGTHAFSVTVRAIDDVGHVIDNAVAAGAADIGRVNFTLTEATRDELRDEALERAVDDARSEAEVIADLKDVEIVGAARVSTTDAGVRPFRLDARALERHDGAAPTEIREGTVTVTAQVEVYYAIE